jgi:hypothetical protein
MPPSRIIVLGSALALIALQESARADNRIENVAIVSESADEVVLDVIYTYDGDQGDNVAVSAVMASNGEVSTHYAHRPARIERGRHRARVRLGTNAGAPEIFSTNRLEIAMYIGGGATFLKRQFDFAKTWSRPGATLSPVVRVAQLRPRLAVQQLETAPAQPDTDQTGAVSRTILPDGAVELHYPDGTIRKLFAGGQTITRPDGTSSTMLYQNAQPPTPPTAPPDASHANWLDAENERLLGIMRTLVGNDEPSIQNYLEREGDLTVYQRIEARTEAVGWLVSP